MHYLFEDGLEKVKAGLTTIEELLRIAAPPEVVSMEAKKDDTTSHTS
jgi:hypothetical protein